MGLPGFERRHTDRWPYLVWPTAGFLLLSALFQFVPVDRYVADWMYQLEGGHWGLRDAWVTSTLIHKGGRQLVLVLVLAMLALIGLGFPLQALRPYRRGLTYVLLSAILSGVLVNVLKAVTHMDCPWDLVRYGGSRTYHGLLDFSAYGHATGQCFPAGHASAAYAWFGWYFFALHHFPRYRRLVLGAVIGFGLVFGIGQQLRGAHFLSHDIWTAWLCWMIAASTAPFGVRPGNDTAANDDLNLHTGEI